VVALYRDVIAQVDPDHPGMSLLVVNVSHDTRYALAQTQTRRISQSQS